jgi:hypothetical protein
MTRARLLDIFGGSKIRNRKILELFEKEMSGDKMSEKEIKRHDITESSHH